MLSFFFNVGDAPEPKPPPAAGACRAPRGAELIGCRANDPRVEHAVMSVQAQCLVMLNDKIASRFHPFQITPKRLDQVADHITTFSLAGIKALRSG